MQDNFDLKKYLRHGNKLLNENIGGYVDLKPINELGNSGYDSDTDAQNWYRDDNLSEDDSEPVKTLTVRIAIKALDELDSEFEKRNNVKVKKPKGAEELAARYDQMDWKEQYTYSDVPVKFTGTKKALGDLLDGDLAAQIYNDSDYMFGRLNRLFNSPKNMNELNDFGMTQEAKGGKASLELDWAGPIPELKAKCKHHKLACKVITMDGPGGGNPLVKIMGTRAAIERFLRDGYAGDMVENPETGEEEFVVDEEQLEMFLDDIEDSNDSMSLEELMGTAMEIEELEKPEKIYADDEEKYDNQDRMFDLGGQQIEQGIIDLLDDGFEADEVLEMCKMFIDAHVQAAAQGKKF